MHVQLHTHKQSPGITCTVSSFFPPFFLIAAGYQRQYDRMRCRGTERSKTDSEQTRQRTKKEKSKENQEGIRECLKGVVLLPPVYFIFSCLMGNTFWITSFKRTLWNHIVMCNLILTRALKIRLGVVLIIIIIIIVVTLTLFAFIVGHRHSQ